MSSVGDFPHERVEETVEGTDYEIVNCNTGFAIDYEDTEIRVRTQLGQVAKELAYLGQILVDFDNPYAYPDQLTSKNRLKQKDILDDNGEVEDPELRFLVGDLLSDFESTPVYHGNKIYEPDEEKSREIAEGVLEYDGEKAFAREIAENIGYNAHVVAFVFYHWEKERNLPSEFRAKEDKRGNIWNIGLLEEEGVIDDILEE